MNRIVIAKFLSPLLAFSLIVFLSASISGQYRFNNWSTDNGLPQNGVRGVAQTPDGYLWVSTFDGLARFDGLKIEAFNRTNSPGILNNRFTSVLVDNEGTLYATVEDGSLTIYKDGVFSTLTPDKIPNGEISASITDENGKILFQTSNRARTIKGWYEYKNGEFILRENEKYNLLDQKRVYKGNSGRLWTITPESVSESLQGKETVYPINFDNLNPMMDVFEDSGGGLWVFQKHLYRLSNGKIQIFGKNEGILPGIFYHSFWEDPDGSVWFGSRGSRSGGIGLVQYKNGIFSFSKKEDISQDIFDMFLDKEGNRWFATDIGLYNRKSEVIKSFSDQIETGKLEAYPIYQDSKGTIWIGSSRGLFTLKDNEFRRVSVTASKEDDYPDFWKDSRLSIFSLWQDEQERMWIGLLGNTFIVKDGIAKELKEARDYRVFVIQPDKKGNVWFGTGKGVLQFRDDKLVNKFTVNDGLANDYVNVIYPDSKGKMWFGGYGGVTAYENGKFTAYTAKDGLQNSAVRSIYEDADGVLWIGTYDEGLSRFKDGKFFNFKKSDGLYSNGVFAIQEDHRGNFWISSNQGIFRVKRQQLNEFADGKINSLTSIGYGKADGMASIECNGGREPASIIDREGNFWFPTQNGIVRVDADAEIYNNYPPPVVVESAEVEHEKRDIRNHLTIPAGERNVEIQYTAISFNKPEQMKFRYKLEGYDADWVEAGTRRSAFYSYLPPGDYVFQVKAANSDGVWNETGAALKIQSLPFFYQTMWFRLLGLLSFIALAVGIWKYSIYNYKKREMKLKRLVDERTAELNAANKELNAVNAELEFLAHSDELTKISNRRHFVKFIKNEWERAVRVKSKASLIILDVDHFKLYNDTYGHHAGDICLQKIAQAIASTVKRPGDLAARFGGEEFIIWLGDTDEKGAVEVARRLLENVIDLQIPHESSKTEKVVTISIGVATLYPENGNFEADLIKKADQALYKAKENGRNQLYVIPESLDEFSALDEEIIL